MNYKTLSDFNFKGKRVLLRLDLNTEVIKGKAQLSERMKAHLITLRELRRKGAKTVILAHQSRPGEPDFISMKQHAKLLSRALVRAANEVSHTNSEPTSKATGCLDERSESTSLTSNSRTNGVKYNKVKFVPDILGKKAIRAITELKPGEALLLENIRSLKEEFSSPEKNDLIKILVPLFNIYINDAFSVSHREQISITGFPKYLPSGVGRVMEQEIKNLERIKLKNALFILGGAKPKENIDILKNSKNILTCGIFGQLCTIAKGYNLGAQNKFLEKEIKEFVPLIKPLIKNVPTPLDFAVNIKGKRKEILLKNFPSKYEIFDIGKKTQKLYAQKIKQAKYIFMKGTAGYCEEKQFCQGTKAILLAVADSKAFSLVGGGHTTNAISKLKINKKKFGYISLSGGALDEYIAGKKLPGLEVLKIK